jgi:hypothetical protein
MIDESIIDEIRLDFWTSSSFAKQTPRLLSGGPYHVIWIKHFFDSNLNNASWASSTALLDRRLFNLGFIKNLSK